MVPIISAVVVTPDDDTLTIEITRTDRESGLYKYYYSKDGGASYVSSQNANYTFTSLEEKDYLIVVYIEDSAGNQSETKVTSTTVRHKSFCEKNGISNLGDCVIATEARIANISNANAAIDAKPKPDFTKISPDIQYKEIHNTTTTYTHTYHSYIGTGYTFNKSTGQYTVTGYTYVDLSTLNYSSRDYYTCNSTSVTCATMNKITKVTTSTNASGVIIYTTTAYQYRQTPESYDSSEVGLYSINDDDGKSYYYRGSVGGNYVKFAGSYWR